MKNARLEKAIIGSEFQGALTMHFLEMNRL